MGAARSAGASAVERESGGGEFVANLEAIRGLIFKSTAAPDDSEFSVHAGLNQRIVGRHSVCAVGGNGAGGNGWPRRIRGGAARIARDDAGGIRNDPRLPSHAMACG